MQRIDELLVKDKFTNLSQVAEILKEEITPLARNFMLLDGDVAVRFHREGVQYVFNVEFTASRIKPFGNRL